MRRAAFSAVRELKEELRLLHEPGSYVGEVIKLMSKKKILVKVQPEGKYVVDFDDKLIKLEDIKPNLRVALRNDTYALHKVRPLASAVHISPVPSPRSLTNTGGVCVSTDLAEQDRPACELDEGGEGAGFNVRYGGRA